MLPCGSGERPAPDPEQATCLDVCGGEDEPDCPKTCGTGLGLDWIVTLPTGSCTRGPTLAAGVREWILVAGTAAADEHTQQWAAAIDPGGCALWSDRDGEGAPFQRTNEIRAVAGRDDVGYFAVGVAGGGQDRDRLGAAWVRRYLPSGDIAWTWQEQTAAAQGASGVAVLPDGSAKVTGGALIGSGGRGWIRTLTADGETSELWWLGDASESYALDVVANASGRTWVSVRMPDSYENGGWFGEVVDRSFAWLQDDFAAEPTRLALATEDSIVAVGANGPRNELQMSRWSGSGELLWSTSGAQYGGVQLFRGAVTQDGRTIVAGAVRGAFVDDEDEPRLLVLGRGGEILSLQTIPGLDVGEVTAVAIAPDGAAYVAGLDGDCDVWVARLSAE